MTSYLTASQFFSDRFSTGAKAIEPQRYVNSDVIRQWLVLLALSNSKAGMPSEFDEGLVHAFAKACRGVHSGQIQLDYHPFDSNTLDIPPVEHPCYMQALLYWSVKLRCSINVLAEMHSTLGNSPSLETATSAARHIEHEELITRTWKNSARRRRSGGETVPVFHQTNIRVH